MSTNQTVLLDLNRMLTPFTRVRSLVSFGPASGLDNAVEKGWDETLGNLPRCGMQTTQVARNTSDSLPPKMQVEGTLPMLAEAVGKGS